MTWVLAACGGDFVQRDGGRIDASFDASIDAGRDAGPPPPSDGGPTFVTVAHDRELRAAWVATVFNLTWPTRSTLSESAARAEMVGILDVMAELRMNAVVLQVRPESDALYASSIEPWSRFLTGTQGRDPGWDPLAAWIEEAHARGIEVHAWMNPYRGMASASATTASNHVTRTLSQYAYPWGTGIWMDPGAPAVREHVVDVARDIVTRYDVDGLHFDDYFYPYPDGSRTFPDDATYAAYTSAGGTLSRADWRRDNVNRLVREVSEAVTAVRDDVRFGISPFGIHRPGMPPGITGLDAYATLFCDAPHWFAEGWVDYLAPQLYWPTTQTAQAFEPLLTWWSSLPRDEGRAIFAGLNLARLGETSAWTVSEIRAQIELTRSARALGSLGTILYTIEPVMEDRLGVRAMLRDEVFTAPAASPPLATARDAVLSPPRIRVEGTLVNVLPPPDVRVRALAVYRAEGDTYQLVRLVPASESTVLEAQDGEDAVSAIDRRGVESAAVVVNGR
jgi:uncharacterized lipoprotein YddW (UPF0748 family)